MEEVGLTQSQVDPCIFYKKGPKGELQLACAIFVDDTIAIGNRRELDKLYKEVKKHYNIELMGNLKKHLGITYNWLKLEGETVLETSMPKMEEEIIETYEKYAGETVKPQSTPGYPGKTLQKHDGEPVDVDQYRSLIGKLLYYMTKVAPEMSNACRELSTYMDSPGPDHWKSVKRAVGYIKGRIGKGLRFRPPKNLNLMSYCDSSYATNPDDRKSVTGTVNTLGGTLLNWSSKKQRIVTLSSTEAEYVALSECAQETKFEWMLLNELLGLTTPATINEDNTGAIFLAKNQQVGPRTKHIDVRHHHLRHQLQEETLTLHFVKSEDNVSDIMTKNCPEKTFLRHSNRLLDGTVESWREDVSEDDTDAGQTDSSQRTSESDRKSE